MNCSTPQKLDQKSWKLYSLQLVSVFAIDIKFYVHALSGNKLCKHLQDWCLIWWRKVHLKIFIALTQFATKTFAVYDAESRHIARTNEPEVFCDGSHSKIESQ